MDKAGRSPTNIPYGCTRLDPGLLGHRNSGSLWEISDH
jgi:hypothetical protein